jgi:BirA family biotin operon repressor/biotin-[acetyl-CoA-carboxylase] ligase
LWVLAREQTGGRGRNGRVWHSPQGNLYASLLLIDPAPPARAPELGFVAAIAVAEVLSAQLGGDPRVKLKWPNDILFDGAKVCGMLLESHALANQKSACVLGIGVNITSFPSGLPYPATSLHAAGGPSLSPEALLNMISERFAFWLNVWSAPDGFASVRQAWLERAAGVREPIQVQTASGKLEGIFKTIDTTGRLILTTREGNDAAISAGDVFLSPSQALAHVPR